MLIIIVTLFRIVIALFGFLVIISTGYELCMKFKKDVNLSQKKLHHHFTVSDNNGVQLNGVKTINTGDLEIKSPQEVSDTTINTNNAVQLNGVTTISTGDLEMKISQEVSAATEQKMMNGSTVVLVQQSNQEFPEKIKSQGIISKSFLHGVVYWDNFHKRFVTWLVAMSQNDILT